MCENDFCKCLLFGDFAVRCNAFLYNNGDTGEIYIYIFYYQRAPVVRRWCIAHSSTDFFSSVVCHALCNIFIPVRKLRFDDICLYRFQKFLVSVLFPSTRFIKKQ